MLINGNAPKWGEVFKNQNHANTLRVISEDLTKIYHLK